MGKPSQLKQYASIIISMIFFSLTFVWFKVANAAYGPLTIVLFRLIIATAILFIIAKVTGKLVKPEKKDLKYLLLLALFEPFLYFMGESYGLQYISSTVAAVIIATIPLVAPFAAYLFYKEKVTILNALGILISFFGVTLVIFELGKGLTAAPLGVILQFVAVISAVAYTIMLQKINKRISNLTIILYQNLIGTFYFLPFWLIFEKNRFIATPFNPESMAAIFELAIFGSTIAFIFFVYSVKHMGVIKSNMFTNSIPVFTSIFAWIILGDNLNIQKITGIIIVTAGLFIAQLNFKKHYRGPDPIPFEG